MSVLIAFFMEKYQTLLQAKSFPVPSTHERIFVPSVNAKRLKSSAPNRDCKLKAASASCSLSPTLAHLHSLLPPGEAGGALLL